MCNVGLCAVPCFMVYHTQIQILSYSIPKDPCQPLVTTLHPHLIQNFIFTCDKHKDKIYYPISNETKFKHLFIKKKQITIKTKSK
jgi:hypothetical protein